MSCGKRSTTGIRRLFEDATARGAEAVFQDFEAAAQTSKAVIARPLRDIERLTSSDRELYPTFYALTQADVRLAYGDKWDRLRRVADESLFPGYKEHIRFAALSLDEVGLADFGDYYLVLKEDMIAHRATAFEENSAAFLEYHRYQEPEGSRATWAERFKLCAAKNAGRSEAGDASFGVSFHSHATKDGDRGEPVRGGSYLRFHVCPRRREGHPQERSQEGSAALQKKLRA